MVFIGCISLKVTVYSVQSKRPIQNANVIIDKDRTGERSGYTDKNGIIIFETLNPMPIPFPRTILVIKELYNDYKGKIPTMCPDTDVYMIPVGYVYTPITCEQKKLDLISYILCKIDELFY